MAMPKMHLMITIEDENLNKKQKKLISFAFRTPAEARTLDTLIKSQVLYQLSYGCIVFCFAGAKVGVLFESTKFLL